MINRVKHCIYPVLLVICVVPLSCKKYLEAKPDQQMAIAATLEDARAMLDNYSTFNSNYPSLGDQSDDNYYLDEIRLAALDVNSRNNYSWAANAVNDYEWATLYQVVLNATAALETIEQVERTAANAVQWDELRGTALFHRGYALCQVAQYYAGIYHPSTAATVPGIPLRLSSSVSDKSYRVSMEATWSYIDSCFREAAVLLPAYTVYKTRPGKAAAYAALARTCLYTGRFAEAAAAADDCLQLQHSLLDFNTVDPASAMPFTRFNEEVIFACAASASYSLLNISVYTIDTSLYASYAENDLRKELYYSLNGYGGYGFKGSYDGDMWGGSFCGIATDEVLLIKAECLARTGDIAGAMEALNTLMEKRWRAGSFTPFSAATRESAIQLILQERRKELIQRGTRWFDLRRLAADTAHAVTPARNINGQGIALLPGSSRYTFLIPQRVIDLTGMQQNNRN